MSKIDSLVQEFVLNLRAAIAEEAAAAFAVVAGGGSSVGNGLLAGQRTGNGRGAKRTIAAAPKAKALPGKRSRRSPEDIEAQKAKILAYVKKNAGSKAEAIGKAVGMSSLDMQIPISQLLAEKSLGKKGERRATVYSAK